MTGRRESVTATKTSFNLHTRAVSLDVFLHHGAVDRSSPVGPELSGALGCSAEKLGISTILNPTWR
ncbi:unnamed protein product [Arctogadus glacialis]